MRRPVSVKSVFLLPPCEFLVFEPGRHLSPSFHPHSFLSDFRSVPVGRTRFSRCCYLIIDLCSLFSKGTGPGLSRSHLLSAVQAPPSPGQPLQPRPPLGGSAPLAHPTLPA